MKKNEFMLIRHGYDDHSYIDGKNDTGLKREKIYEVKRTAEEVLRRIDSDKIIIRHSTKLRGKETAEIICEYLLKHNIYVSCIQEKGLTELCQGDFNFCGLTHDERVNFLQSCWDDFEKCRLNGDLSHRFGQNKDKNVIIGLGENHAEWSSRIASGVLNILDDLDKNYQSINITHRGAIFEITNIINMVNGNMNFDDVERYETIWLSYCQSRILEVDNIEKSKILTKQYMNKRAGIK